MLTTKGGNPRFCVNTQMCFSWASLSFAKLVWPLVLVQEGRNSCGMLKYGIMSHSFEGMTAAPVMPRGPQLCSGAAPGKADYKSITRASLWEKCWLECWASMLCLDFACHACFRGDPQD